MRKHWGKAVLGLVVTAFFLWLALRDVPFSDVWTEMRRGDPFLLAGCIIVATLGFVIRAMRWKVLLQPIYSGTSFHSRFASVSIGFMANNVLPARVGEFARAMALSRLEPVKASGAFGSLVVERVLDGVVLLSFLIIPVLTPNFPGAALFDEGYGRALLRFGLVGVTVVLVALVAMAFFPRSFTRGIERVAKVLPAVVGRPLVAAIESFLESVEILRNPVLLLTALAWSFFFWTFHATSFWLGMLAFGIDTGFVSAIFTTAVVGFGVALPSAPGFIGLFQAAARFALTDVYGVAPTQSLAFGFAYNVGTWFPITVIGLWFAWKVGMSLGDVGAAEERVEDRVEAAHPEVDMPKK